MNIGEKWRSYTKTSKHCCNLYLSHQIYYFWKSYYHVFILVLHFEKIYTCRISNGNKLKATDKNLLLFHVTGEVAHSIGMHCCSCHGEHTIIFQNLWALLIIWLIFKATKDGSNIEVFAEQCFVKSWLLVDSALLFRI